MDFFKAHILWISVGVFIIAILGGYYSLVSPPSNFPSGSIVVISQGASAPQVAKQLADAHVISRPFFLETILRVGAGSTSIQAGAYLFQNPQNLFAIAYRLVTGTYGLPAVRITFVEGVTVREMSEQVAEAFTDISAPKFFSQGQSQEGYLFPDTYLFQPSSDIESILKTMRDNFDAKIATLSEDIKTSGHSLSDIVIMASLVEKEARSSEVRRTVAGILYNRLEQDIPLQVDAVFGYIFGRDTYSPSLDDLKTGSLYNTYTNKGLPPGPICNPGLDSLEATLHPTKTDYLYYLTDKDGVMHYAKTFAEHQANRKKYLK